MTTENNSGKFKVLIGILTVLLIALAAYTIKLYNDSSEKVTGLEEQKTVIEGELEELIANYDEIIQENELKDQELLAARDRIEVLLDSVKDAEANMDLIRRYKIEVGKLKTERTMLFRKADSLIAVNQRLLVERDSTNTMLSETRKVVDSVNMTNEQMSRTIRRASIVGTTDLRGEAVIVRNNGKIVDTRRSSRADRIRTCFTLVANPVAQAGDRNFYIQVFNPNQVLLGERAQYRTENGMLEYSSTSRVYYENDELDVCILTNASEDQLIEGTYSIMVYDGLNPVGTTTMVLK
jgi:hypothetical protein